ncbi:hypothetical protein C1646_822525 [Rhizophagus diaphanus]|nr:hypothetical protein C1646_822525 [Rhizophagus diaphanus] [Rhizophagus sp. MUCL 43196]
MRSNFLLFESSDIKVIESLEVKPDWVTFLSDNEAGEAKTSIDSHHTQVCIDCSNNLGNHHYYLLNHWLQISHAINHYIQLGFDINEGVDIKNAIQGICGTSVAYLEPVRKKGICENTILKLYNITESNYYDLDERKKKNFNTRKFQLPAKIAQFEKRPLEKLNPQVSDHSIPTSDWNIPLPHKSIILAEILQNKLNDEILSQNIDILNTKIIDTDLGSRQVLNHTSNFALSSGWALKENQKFGKKEGGKRISKNVILYLEVYFLARDINKSEKYTAQEMHNELKDLVEEGVLEEEKILKISTISNWISRYAQTYRKLKAQQALTLVDRS